MSSLQVVSPALVAKWNPVRGFHLARMPEIKLPTLHITEVGQAGAVSSCYESRSCCTYPRRILGSGGQVEEEAPALTSGLWFFMFFAFLDAFLDDFSSGNCFSV